MAYELLSLCVCLSPVLLKAGKGGVEDDFVWACIVDVNRRRFSSIILPVILETITKVRVFFLLL